MVVYEWLVGSSSLKVVYIFFNNYQNAGGALSVALNAPFTNSAFLGSMGGKGVQLWAGGSQLTTSINVLTTLASGGGTATTVNILNSWCIGQCKAAFDTIKEPGGNATAATGCTVMIGF